MPRAALPSGIEIEYETFGSADDPALLLIMGFTAQLISWDERFCRRLADGGRYVIRFDNRDCGLSTTLDGVEVDLGQVIGAAMAGQPLPEVPYTLSDMAADAVGLLDHLGIERAHVLGASMGGMIAQTVAIEHPARVASLISIMSMTGELEYGAADAGGHGRPDDPTAPRPRRRRGLGRGERGVVVPTVVRPGPGPGELRPQLRPPLLPGGRAAPARRHLRLRSPDGHPADRDRRRPWSSTVSTTR